jgi:4'-phosphopantetheinyl transferase
MITVLYASFDTPLSEARWQYYISQVPLSLQNKILSYHRWQDRHAGLFGKLLLSQGLTLYGYSADSLNHLSYTEFGRPYLDNSSIDFNISHSGDYVVCAITAQGRIGIDIEKIKPIDLSGFERYMTSSEWKSIRESAEPYHTFYSYWTKKESAMKAYGFGLSVPLDKILIDNDKAVFYTNNSSIININTATNNNLFLHEMIINASYKCHLATPVDKVNIRIFETRIPERKERCTESLNSFL